MALSKMVFKRNHYVKVRERASSIHAQKLVKCNNNNNNEPCYFSLKIMNGASSPSKNHSVHPLTICPLQVHSWVGHSKNPLGWVHSSRVQGLGLGFIVLVRHQGSLVPLKYPSAPFVEESPQDDKGPAPSACLQPTS